MNSLSNFTGRNRAFSRHLVVLGLTIAGLGVLTAADWAVTERPNSTGPGREVAVQHQGGLVARFIYGEGQSKPFLHLYGEEGELLTNAGLDADGKPAGQFPHHRGLFIGWKNSSNLGNYDHWHMGGGARMEVVELEKLDGMEKAATIVARIGWLAPKADAQGNNVVLSERRTMVISRPRPKQTQVDLHTALSAGREVRLAGDLQHSGVHFRANNEVNARKNETSYLYEPDNVVKGDNLRWARLLFPIGERWYAVQQMNAPQNPVEELSMRNYGRFGYFFKTTIPKGEALELDYRFLIEAVEAPDQGAKVSPDQSAAARRLSETRYGEFSKALTK